MAGSLIRQEGLKAWPRRLAAEWFFVGIAETSAAHARPIIGTHALTAIGPDSRGAFTHERPISPPPVLGAFRVGEVMQSYLNSMTDADLISATAEARTAAHQAPMGEKTDVNKHGKPTGERFITNHTNGWAARANDWVKLSDECERRGLPQPSCNCPPGAH